MRYYTLEQIAKSNITGYSKYTLKDFVYRGELKRTGIGVIRISSKSLKEFCEERGFKFEESDLLDTLNSKDMNKKIEKLKVQIRQSKEHTARLRKRILNIEKILKIR